MMSENNIQLIGALLAILLSIIGYFLKVLHKDVKENIRNTEQNATNIKLLQSQQDGKIDKLATQTELQIQQLTKAVEQLTSTVAHMNNNMKDRDTVFTLLLRKLEILDET